MPLRISPPGSAHVTAQAVAAAASAQAAGVSEANAQAAWAYFDQRYRGAKASPPTLDNSGNPLVDGAIYFDTTVNHWRVYDLGQGGWLTPAFDPSSVGITGGTVSGVALITPRIGTLLDANANPILATSPVAAAVNCLNVLNAATGGAITLGATGSDPNIGIDIAPKGAGLLTRAGNRIWDAGNHGSGSGLDADLWDGLDRAIGCDTARAAVTGYGLPIATWTIVATTAVYARSGSVRVHGFGQFTALATAINAYLYVSISAVGQSQNALAWIGPNSYLSLAAEYFVDGLARDGAYTGNLHAYASSGAWFTGDLNMEG